MAAWAYRIFPYLGCVKGIVSRGRRPARGGRGTSERAQTLPEAYQRPRISKRAVPSDLSGLETRAVSPTFGKYHVMLTLALTSGFLAATGCGPQRGPAAVVPRPDVAQVVVAVAPVLNLSNSSDWDSLRVTDIVASEFQSFPGVFVIPVNRTLATLALMGKEAVETPEDAVDLARELNADATVVTAITEYDPYYPPIIGVVMQWYGRPPHEPLGGFDPVSASRQTSEVAPAASSAARLVQVQRVYNAADESVQAEVRSFGAWRSKHGSPHGWRIHLKSQELFVRYSCWASIRSILLEGGWYRTAPKGGEAKQCKQNDDV